jgi:error-prone DNA polymerase
VIGIEGRVQREGEVMHIIALRLHDLSGEFAQLGDREAFPLPHGRGDGFHHGSAGGDTREPLMALHVKARDFR